MALEHVDEQTFREVLRRHFTPARPISSHQYLRGRELKLRDIDRAFNSEGKHIFIFGDRGVGKTSLARTAAFMFGPSTPEHPTIECEAKSTFYQLLRDIAVRCLPSRVLIEASTTKSGAKVGPSFFGVETQKEIKSGQIPEIRSMNEALAIISYVATLNAERPIIIIDEFDLIEDQETRRSFASFLKHISDQDIPIRFIVCGIGDSLDEMIGSHLSTGRYLKPIELDRLSHDARWEIVASAAEELKIGVDRESVIRIGQISDGYPYYIHLIGDKLFWAMFDDDKIIECSSPQHFETALREASIEAEPSLKRAYEQATQKYKDEYQQVLWALADASSLRRQIKEVMSSYTRIMAGQPGREPLDQKRFYDRMNALKTERHGRIVRTPSAGWYEFRENRLRGYVRLIAERNGVQLEPEHHLGGRRFPPFKRATTLDDVR